MGSMRPIRFLALLGCVLGGVWSCTESHLFVQATREAPPALTTPATPAMVATLAPQTAGLPEERLADHPMVRPPDSPEAPTPEPQPADPQLLDALRRLQDVRFAYDSAALSAAARAAIQANARILQRFPHQPVVLEGRADERGTADYNLLLAERRAARVRTFLRDLGLPETLMTAVSYGAARPLCREHAEVCWQVNRSVRFVLEDTRQVAQHP